MKKRKIILLASSMLLLSGCMLSLGAKLFILEADKDKDGELNFEEFFSIQENDDETKELAEAKKLTHREYAQQEFKGADSDNNEKLSKEEFTKYLKKKKRELK